MDKVHTKKVDIVFSECSLLSSFRSRRSLLKMEALFHKVRNTDKGEKRRIVQLINLGVFQSKFLPVAAELAYFSAKHRNRKTLLLDTSKNGRLVQSLTAIPADLEEDDELCISSVRGTELYLMRMPKTKVGGMVEKDDIKILFDSIYEQFDFIVVHSDSPLISPEVSNFSELSDGCALVLQSERTRIPVMKHIIEQLELSGANFIGTVVDGRRFYIPRFIYNVLFKS